MPKGGYVKYSANYPNHSFLKKFSIVGIVIYFFISFFFTSVFTEARFCVVYSQEPTQQWVARYRRPRLSSGTANQMALDKVGNCYVLGNLPVSGGNNGMVLIKYNSAGDTIWTRTYYPGSGNTAGNVAVASDSVGNCYITGYIGPALGPYDIVLIKYNLSGTQQWIRFYSGAANANDSVGGISLDNLGRPYLAGLSGNDALITKYDTNGDSIWVRKFNMAGYRCSVGSVAISNQNDVYLGGRSKSISSNPSHFLTIKYDSNGALLWYDDYTTNGQESMYKMTIDVFDNCYVTGRGGDGLLYGGLTMKYSSNGTKIWLHAFRYDGEIVDLIDIITDSNGSAYVTGSYFNAPTDYNFVTLKYNPGGDIVWTKMYNGPTTGYDQSYSIAKDDSNNIYVTGRSQIGSTNWDYVTIKYRSTDGFQQWTAFYSNPPLNLIDLGYVVRVDKNNNVYVTGVSNTYDGSDYATIKYSQVVGLDPLYGRIPNRYSLEQNQPNPFNPYTSIKYQLPSSAYVELLVYDILGNEIACLMNRRQAAGFHYVTFDAANLPTGIYFYKLETENFNDTKKMILIK